MFDDYDLMDFDLRDEIDAAQEDAAAHLRESLTGLPARPGTIR